MMSLLSTVLLSCVIGVVVAFGPPGFKARFTPTLLAFVSQRAKSEIPLLALHRSLPDQEGDINIHIGVIHYSVYGLSIADVSIESVKIYPYGQGLGVSLNGIEISVTGDWNDKFNWLPIGDSGTVAVYVQGISLKFSFIVGYDYIRRPTVHVDTSHCAFSVEDVSVSLRGRRIHEWIYRRIEGRIAGMIKDKLNEQACSLLVEEINTKVAEQLRNLKVVRPITKHAEIDIGIISQPSFDLSVTTDHKGTVYEIGHHLEPPFNIPSLPYDHDQSKMMIFWITDYVANSACYVLHNTHFFRYQLTNDSVPAYINLNLNTSSFQMKFLLPQISAMYPKGLLQFYMNTTAPPKVTFGVNNVSVLVEGDVAAYVTQQNHSATYLFTLGATVKVGAALSTCMTNVTWNKTHISYGVKLLKSSIPVFKIEELQRKLKLALKLFVIPKVQQMGKVGIPLPNLPLRGYGIRNLMISHGQNFLKIGTDFNYQF